MKKSSKSFSRPTGSKASSGTSKASEDARKSTEVSSHAGGATAGDAPIAISQELEEPGTNVWRSTRLRAGHTTKIDYLKLHNFSSSSSAVRPKEPLSEFALAHRKRPAMSLTPRASSIADKRPRLLASAVSAAHSPGAASSSSYTCPVCSFVSSSSRSFDQHIVVNHPDAQPFQCVFCDLHLRTTKALQHHYVKHHRVNCHVPECLNWRLSMQCRACGQSFHTAEHLAQHMDWAHSRCSSIVLMEKLPDDWGWKRDQQAILESADAVEEEFDLAFPGRRLFYEGHPGLLEMDMSIRLQPAAPSAAAAAPPAGGGGAARNFDVYAFTDEGGEPAGGDIEIDIVPTPSKDAGAFGGGGGGGGRKRRQQPQAARQKQHRSPAKEIDFEQLLRRDGDVEDDEVEAQAGAEPQQQQQQKQQPKQQPKPKPQGKSPQRQKQQQQQQQRRGQIQKQPFASDTPHYVASRADVPAPHQSFPCPICMADMATLKSRDRHLLQRHPGVRAFACLECNCTFEIYIALRRHVRAEHPQAESGAYKLLIAPGLRRRANQRAATTSAAIAAAAVNQLSAHYATDSKRGGGGGLGLRQRGQGQESGGSGPAGDIDLDTSASASLTGKVESMDELKLTCELCSAHFEKITALECHIATDHVNETPYECHLCPAYFPVFGRLRHHQRTVHRVFLHWKEPPQTVLSKLRARSPTTSATVLNLAVPLRRSEMAKVAHQQLKFFDPQAASSVNLESVISDMPPADMVIFCDFCGEACHNKLELGRHLQSHSGKRLRFGCSKCGQVFEGWNAKSDLMDHLKVDHMGKARYRCTQCEAQFKYSSLLKVHKERGCNSNKPLSRPVVSYGCSNCEKIFCGELSADRYRQHTQQCPGQLNRALPSSAAVLPPPTAVISGLDNDDAGDEIAATGAFDSSGNAGASAASDGARLVQVTLPGSKEPVSVLIHLEGPLTPETLSQAFVIQGTTFGGEDAAAETSATSAAAAAAAAAAEAEPLQSLADVAAAASASTAAATSAVPFLA